MGINFLGIKFDTNIWYLLDIEKHSKSCGGVLAHPDKGYPCSGMESYWDFQQNMPDTWKWNVIINLLWKDSHLHSICGKFYQMNENSGHKLELF